MSDEQADCPHEHRTQRERVDHRETGPVKTVTITCDDCGRVVRSFAVAG